jgi:hypothetical protein
MTASPKVPARDNDSSDGLSGGRRFRDNFFIFSTPGVDDAAALCHDPEINFVCAVCLAAHFGLHL